MKTPKPSDRPAAPPADAAGDAAAEPAEGAATPPKPPPEPLTPARVLEWNAYYDLFVAGFALLLCFVAAATTIDNATIWSYLRAGQLIDSKGGPITAEPFSYAAEGLEWINVPWLFEWGSYRLFEFGRGLADTMDRPEQADQFAGGALVAVNAGLRALAALLLLLIRRRGPGLWWASITSALALGVVLTPLGGDPLRVALGGMAGMGATVTPGTWGLLLLAIELLLLHWAYNLGRRGAIFALVPLLALWANVDDSFAVGLILLAARVVGSGIKPGRVDGPEGARAPGLPIGLGVLVLCGLACLANPSVGRVYVAGFAPLADVFRPVAGTMMLDELTLLPFGDRGVESRAHFGEAEVPRLVGFYAMLLFLGLGSFLLNRRQFDLGRFLMFLAAALLAALLWRLQEVLALVLAVSLALNGQEWFQDRFGTEGRMALGWRLWSVGGRLATLLLLTLATLAGLTGFGKIYGEPIFGFGIEPDRFAFEAADYLRDAPIEGHVMNLRLSLGDALNWRSYPSTRPFVDSRLPRSAAGLLKDYETVRAALAEGDRETWAPILDRHGVSVLMVDLPLSNQLSSKLTDALEASPDWAPFYDDGAVLLYGRVDDAPAVSDADRSYFEAQSLQAEAIAFGRGNPVKPFDRPPQPTDVIDRFLRGRALAPVQPHVLAARRWLRRGSEAAGGAGAIPDIAASLVAIQECRNALSIRPDDPDAFFILGIAYRFLAQREVELLANAGDPDVLSGAVTAPMRLRMEQRMAALNFFIQTVPKPPANAEARLTLRNARLELANLFETNGSVDLARDQLEAALPLFEIPAATEEEDALLQSIGAAVDALTEQVELVRSELEEASLEGQADAAQLGNAALGRGMTGLAIRYFEEAEASGIGLASVRTRLIDLYCETGQPDRAIDVLNNPETDPSAVPGSDKFRQGRVYFLMGDYRTAVGLWGNLALPELRSSRSHDAFDIVKLLLQGEPMGAVKTALELPSRTDQQANWDYLLGQAALEGGTPSQAGEPLSSALVLLPDHPARPIIAELLGRLGLDVPPPPDETPDAPSDPPAEGDSESAATTSPTDVSADSGDSSVPDDPEGGDPDSNGAAPPDAP